MRALRGVGEEADGALRQALRGDPSAEQRRRVEVLLEELSVRPYPTDELRRLRAVVVLEWVGSAGSRRLLERLAEGTAEATHVREARAALKRLQALANGP
jgi:hypothetical protein